MEQANYTNKYLQIIGENLVKQKTIDNSVAQVSETESKPPLEKLLFKPHNNSRNLRKEIWKQFSNPIKQDEDEFLNKINQQIKLLNTIAPKTPQQSIVVLQKHLKIG